MDEMTIMTCRDTTDEDIRRLRRRKKECKSGYRVLGPKGSNLLYTYTVLSQLLFLERENRDE